MAPFYGWGSTASRLEPLRGGSLLFTTKFPEISGTHFTDLRRMKGWVDLGATQWFWTPDPWIGIPAPWPLGHWLGNRCQMRLASFSLMISCTTETFPRKNKLWLSSTNLTKANLTLLCLKYSRWFFLVTIPPFYFQISWITGALS